MDSQPQRGASRQPPAASTHLGTSAENSGGTEWGKHTTPLGQSRSTLFAPPSTTATRSGTAGEPRGTRELSRTYQPLSSLP